MAKPDYHGKDFFQRKEFRGLLLADYQEAIGEKAFACVDQLNTNTVSQFSNLKSFREALGKKKLVEKFYKGGGMKDNKSSGTRGGSVTDRSMRGGSLLTKKSVFKSGKNSEQGIAGSELMIQNSFGHQNYQTFGNVADSEQLMLFENANQITTSYSQKPSGRSRMRNKPQENFPDVKRNPLLSEGFNTQKYTATQRGSEDIEPASLT